jgi:SAM-dependent methyltransferase
LNSPTAKELCHRRKTCRLCGGDRLTLVLKLAPTPPANAFVSKDELNKPQPSFPLDVFFCEDCTHAQLLDVVDPSVLFEKYVYVSGTSPSFVAHFESYARDLLAQFKPPPGGLVVDIGSNDGTLLRFFQRAGMKVLGIDPARDIAKDATRDGIPTLAAFFSPPLAKELREKHGTASIITANNVFAHIDNLAGVVEGVQTLLGPDGIFVFEVSYLPDVLEKTLFDTIYHEHLDYHSVTPLVPFFRRLGMELIEAQRVSSHGGSLRGIAQLKGGPRAVGKSVADAMAAEKSLGLHHPETFHQFGRNIDSLKMALGKLLRELKSEGKTIAGFGAPAKATTLMYHFDIGPDVIDFIAEDSPLKQNLFTPGHHIPVLPRTAIYEKHPDYILILAWNFAESIIKSLRSYAETGGQFIVPIPELQIHNSHHAAK